MTVVRTVAQEDGEPSSTRTWAIEQTRRAGEVPVLRTNVEKADDDLTLLFLGDLHWDHSLADRKALRTVLDQAIDRDAVIVLLGDQLCAMQGAGDRRGHKSALRTEHKEDGYLSALVDTWCEWYEPYARNTWVVLEGNHEGAIRKHHEIDLTRLWVRQLNASAGASMQYPGYTSYAMIRNRAHTRKMTVPFWVGHGHGGGGPVSRGSIQAQRRAVMYPDARFLVTGHIHSSYGIDHEQLRVNDAGRVSMTVQEHYSVGTWKDEYGKGEGGWHVERGMGPRQKSGWWARFRYTNNRGFRWSFEKATA